MQVIQLHHPYRPDDIIDESIVLALGFFDGVHLGHQAVIQRAQQEAQLRGIKLAVMTFNQHPKIIYSNIDAQSVKYLSTTDRKLELFEGLGVDVTYLIDYTLDFGMQSPQSFVDEYIVGLKAEVVVAGFDYTYGKKDIANMQTLEGHAKGRFDIIEISELTMHEHKVGSTSIKDLLTHGNLEEANQQLGYIYQTSGYVVPGDQRGRDMGYPTANVKTNPQELLPSIGVYSVEIHVDGQWHQGMASIGYNVTFEGIRDLRCEVNIFDFDRDIYGQQVQIRWHHYLRPEIKFASAEALIEQLQQDEVDSRHFFAEPNY